MGVGMTPNEKLTGGAYRSPVQRHVRLDGISEMAGYAVANPPCRAQSLFSAKDDVVR